MEADASRNAAGRVLGVVPSELRGDDGGPGLVEAIRAARAGQDVEDLEEAESFRAAADADETAEGVEREVAAGSGKGHRRTRTREASRRADG